MQQVPVRLWLHIPVGLWRSSAVGRFQRGKNTVRLTYDARELICNHSRVPPASSCVSPFKDLRLLITQLTTCNKKTCFSCIFMT